MLSKSEITKLVKTCPLKIFQKISLLFGIVNLLKPLIFYLLRLKYTIKYFYIGRQNIFLIFITIFEGKLINGGGHHNLTLLNILVNM